ncbi:MAG: DUF4214 domain-containing protein [Alphaproteobacteria bacterium]|nr:DUF4214 domain-containing protein [Alphaproteobacteria bacterium]
MATTSEQITQLYVGYFDRAPDPSGLNYWISRFNSGMGLLEIAQSFSVQSETRSSYSFLALPSVGSADGFLDSVYRNLFNRTIDAEGLRYWKGELDAGKPVGRVIVDIISGAQGADKTIVENKTVVGQFYVSHLVNSTGETFRLSDARQVLDNVNATQASVASAENLALSLLSDGLTLTFDDPLNILAPYQTGISQSIHAAWNLWEAYFTRHASIELVIDILPASENTLASAGSSVTRSTGEFDHDRRVFQAGVGYELATGVDPNGSAPDGKISLGQNLSDFAFRGSLNDPLPGSKYDAITVFAHEIGHLLGFSSGSLSLGQSVNSFDRYVVGVSNPVFAGPAALAANAGNAVPLDPASRSHLADRLDLMAANLAMGQARPVELLHLAILQDTGLPVSLLGVDTLV